MVDNSTLVRLLRQLTVETDRIVELFGERQGMHRTDLNALALIMDAPEALSPGRLAEAMHLSASATTSVIDRLEAAGHIRRTRSDQDRRRIELEVRTEARESGRGHFGPLDAAFTKAWADFTDDERAVAARFLTASIEAMVSARRTA
ncbi:MarR family transcriptional regulator [Saccharothrix violaceirubra]|uniref:DNA-binding MarR family transcriptional regulator n=1 Tax=Saccharothrix violaceirubra TaxID=413306 RepID=A0A7W7WV18_9PSEU|nr:MarR family transcriptional regulator [Saccharothrix violaceirubra]MBB4964849.1 DNA-binding MarR family transcriptional regulator [Saccharothrix violaceirubra]